LFAASGQPAAQVDASGKPKATKVVTADSGRPKLTLTADGGEHQKVYEVLPDAVVELNGSPADIGDISAGDLVTVTTDEHGKVRSVSAERYHAGIVFGTSQGKVEITTDFTDKKSYELATDGK